MANDQLEIAAIAMANQAIAYSKTKRMSKAIQAIQQAIHISSKIYRTKSYEVRDYFHECILCFYHLMLYSM